MQEIARMNLSHQIWFFGVAYVDRSPRSDFERVDVFQLRQHQQERVIIGAFIVRASRGSRTRNQCRVTIARIAVCASLRRNGVRRVSRVVSIGPLPNRKASVRP